MIIRKPDTFYLSPCRYFDLMDNKEFPKSEIDKHSSWYKLKCDKYGREIYYENSSGFWVIWEYDENNNLTYKEYIYGVIIDNRK